MTLEHSSRLARLFRALSAYYMELAPILTVKLTVLATHPLSATHASCPLTSNARILLGSEMGSPILLALWAFVRRASDLASAASVWKRLDASSVCMMWVLES